MSTVMKDADPMGELVRDALFSLGLAAITALGAWMLLPGMPGGEWAILVRGVVTLVLAGIVFGLGWFFTVLLAMEGMSV